MTVSNSSLSSLSLSLDHQGLSQMLSSRENVLIIQDLDGVCMSLVKDPLTRIIDPQYLRAAKSLGNHFFVLTNGEHIGTRGVNGIVDKALGDQAKQEGLYLHGLAGGGVQWQDSYGNVSHPGVSDAEMKFLKAVPQQMTNFLHNFGTQLKSGLSSEQLTECIEATVLDNKVSPTANLNVFHEAFQDTPNIYADLQQQTKSFTDNLLQKAQSQGLGNSFFVHYAPNLGRDNEGNEIMQPSQDKDSGTTDFQFMLRGGIKEVGVLVILNYYYYVQTGNYPLGQDFNARQAPREQQALLGLVKDKFDPAIMPTMVGVGDTVTSKAITQAGHLDFKRGGSDRGFLELIQALGQEFDTDNVVVYVDSSAGEVKNRQALEVDKTDSQAPKILSGPGDLRDQEDPLTLNIAFPGGYEEYVEFFCHVAQQRQF